MYARAVDEAGVRLRELRREEWEDLALGGLALALALVATQVRPALAMPLFVGGLVAGALGVRAVWRRWDLVERLAGERDAYVIPEVLEHAAREARMDRRRTFAAVIRATVETPGPFLGPRLVPVADELEALAEELDDPALGLDPAAAVACMRFLSAPESPLFDPATTPEELRAGVLRIRAGFTHPPGP